MLPYVSTPAAMLQSLPIPVNLPEAALAILTNPLLVAGTLGPPCSESPRTRAKGTLSQSWLVLQLNRLNSQTPQLPRRVIPIEDIVQVPASDEVVGVDPESLLVISSGIIEPALLAVGLQPARSVPP